MTQPYRFLFLLAATLIAVLTSLASARADDGAAARDVIESQITAFLNDDAATAYSFAAPSIKVVPLRWACPRWNV